MTKTLPVPIFVDWCIIILYMYSVVSIIIYCKFCIKIIPTSKVFHMGDSFLHLVAKRPSNLGSNRLGKTRYITIEWHLAMSIGMICPTPQWHHRYVALYHYTYPRPQSRTPQWNCCSLLYQTCLLPCSKSAKAHSAGWSCGPPGTRWSWWFHSGCPQQQFHHHCPVGGIQES